MQHSREKNATLLFGFLVVLGVSYTYFTKVNSSYQAITNFDTCVKAGFVVMPTYPEVCVMPGKRFTNERQHAAPETVTTAQEVHTPENDYKNGTYFFEDGSVLFREGVATTTRLKASAITTLMILPGVLKEDLNQDGVHDLMFLVAEQGTEKRYLGAFLSLEKGYTGANLILVDRDTSTSTISYQDHSILFTSSQAQHRYVLERNILVKKQ